MPPLPP